MKCNKAMLFISLVVVLVFTGCESTNGGHRTAAGAATGGLIGATAGGIIGHQKGRGLEGAAIGAGAGLLTGALVGRALDQKALATNPNRLTITKIAEMGAIGVPDDVIIDEIKTTKSTYHLTAEVITYLKSNNISDRVINYMMSTSKK